MPNRIIKESICVSEQIDELKPFEEIFFYRLLVNCDDYGCMDAREKILASSLFPLKNLHLSDITKSLRRLSDVGLIKLYTVDGKPYLKVIKWGEHQRLRVSKHKYPEPKNDDAADCGDSRQVAASCGELRQDAADCGLTRAREESESESESESEYQSESEYESHAHTREESTTERDEFFDRFWAEYPRKESKPAARKAFDKIKPDEELLDRMIDSVWQWKKTAQWQENGGQFVPYPATWLNQRKWEDDVPVNRTAGNVKKLPAQDFEQRDYSGEQEDWADRLIAFQREGRV